MNSTRQSRAVLRTPEYSVKVGVQYLQYCLELAECTGPADISRIELALRATTTAQAILHGH